MTKMSKAAIEKSLTALKADIAVALESANTMRDKVQHALVGCVSHYSMTKSNAGLTEIVNGFINELGQGVNLKAVVAWCKEHLHMIEHADGKSLVFTPIKADVLSTEKAASDKWWNHKQQTVFSFDLTAQIIALANKAAKAQSKSDDPEAEVRIDADLLKQLNLIAEKAKAKTAA